ncbi:hypothetical protein [Gloeobacter kilaueensis]|uniref:Uncharacterized protein n=1 Tax=Gloeobacter kilaueensis (strain ATCC BAA-2537 / CCAP 1431/1 / ULC 316 / JS1) TaxID=1183438 RepID=U5QH92_GLOK1|nr:hypothetical protein [Gloeobacter kilaueensis]AGY57030.1 hypothetical protein GKIL_0784 [Gloeobacter kilaueensis JS1]
MSNQLTSAEVERLRLLLKIFETRIDERIVIEENRQSTLSFKASKPAPVEGPVGVPAHLIGAGCKLRLSAEAIEQLGQGPWYAATVVDTSSGRLQVCRSAASEVVDIPASWVLAAYEFDPEGSFVPKV